MTKIPLFRKSVLSLVLAACAALTGCSSDKDNDGIADGTDQCPTVSAGRTPDPARAGCPAADTDRDGVIDGTDICPGMPAGQTPDPARAGCPAPVVIPTIPTPPPVLPNGEDHDGDGVLNESDQCPTVPAGTTDERDPSRTGCPAGDGDGDGVKDHDDRCPGDSSTTENDPDGDGCANPDGDHDGVLDAVDQCPNLPQTPDAGTLSGDGGTVETDASATDVVDAGNPHPGCPAGHEPTVILDGGSAVEADATVTNNDPDGGAVQVADASMATNDVVPGNGNTTIIVQVSPPPTPAPVVDAGAPSQPIPTERTVAGLAVGTLIEGASDRQMANSFCWVTRRQVEYLMSHAFNRVCRGGETGCWRLAAANVHVQNCSNPATPGCQYQDGRIFACAEGAESVITWRCAEGTVPCTAQNAADAWRSRRHPSR
jgi:hypothetical protein